MTAISPFSPYYGRTVTVVASAIDSSTNVPVTNRSVMSRQLLVSNVGTQTVFMRAVDSGITTPASSADMPILANTQALITTSFTESFNIHIIAPGGSGSTVYLTFGDGF